MGPIQLLLEVLALRKEVLYRAGDLARKGDPCITCGDPGICGIRGGPIDGDGNGERA